MKPTFLTLCFSFLLVLQSVNGQDDVSPAPSAAIKMPMLKVSVQNGNILQQDRGFFKIPDEDGDFFKATRTFMVEYGWQVWGGQAWHQLCKYPRMGIGAQYMRVLRRNELGHPFSLYVFYDGNYFRSKHFELTNRMAVGMTYGFAVWDTLAVWPGDWPNDIFSTKLNSFIEIGAGIALRLNQHLYIEPGFRLTHYSNGNTKEPQKGLNITSYTIGLRSVFGDLSSEPVRMQIDEPFKRHEVHAFLGIGPRQYDFIDDSTRYHNTYGMNFLVANLHLGYCYSLNRRFKLGIGIDVLYDGTNGMKEAASEGKPRRSDVSVREKSALAFFIGGEKDIDKLTVIGYLGYIVAQTRFESTSPAFEQRLGFKYHFYRNVFAGVNVRAYNFRAAKAVEFNMGFRRLL